MSDAGTVFSSESIRRGAAWLRGGGAEADVVVSSRVRLARNLMRWPFLTKATIEQRQEILNICRERILEAGLAERVLWVDVHRSPQTDRALMVERHLISKEHAKGDLPRGVAVSLPDEALSIMVNEEDHLRIQVVKSGLELAEAFARANEADDLLEAKLDYAFSDRFGYLTACPTNVGTGIRVSVMLHLPGLKLMGEMDKVRRATRDMSLAVRGYYGEGSEALGEFYQISNQTTLGKSEEVILHEFEHEVIPQIIEYERVSREQLINKRARLVEDKVFRALGTLRYARLLTPDEAVPMLSMVRLGILMGLITDISEQAVNQLILLVQPAHLQRALGRELDQGQRREERADLVRTRIEGALGNGA